jgi:MoxR-like ATPase
MSETRAGKKSRKTGESGEAAESRSPRLGWELVRRVLASALVNRVYLFGPPGVGKTWCAYHEGRVERGVYAITLMPEMPASELRGNYLPRGGDFDWCDGPLVRAMREGARVVINEISHASEDVLAFLYPVLEFPATARVTLPTSEVVRPAPGFSVVVTDNLPPDDLPAALRDRFDAILEVSEPHPDALAALPEALREIARCTMGLEDERRTSMRPWLVLAELQHEIGLENACLVIFGAERGSQIHEAIRLAKEEIAC